MLNSSMTEVMREGFSSTLDWWNLVVATEGTTLKDGGHPKANAPIPVELLIVTITTNYPNKRNQEDVKRLYKWVGLDTLSTEVHVLGGWTMLVSNSRVVENLRAGIAPGEILRELLRMGLNLKGILYYIILRGIAFVDDHALTIPRLDGLGYA